MKIKNKRTKSKKPLIIILILFIVLAVILVSYLYIKFENNKNNVKENKVEKIDKNIDKSTDNRTKDKLEINKKPNTKDELENKKLEQTNTDTPPKPQKDPETNIYNVNITSSVNSDQNNIYLRGAIETKVVGGECSAILNGPNGESETIKTDLLDGPTFTSCKTINVQKSSLTPGKWNFKIKYNSKDTKGESDVQSFTVK